MSNSESKYQYYCSERVNHAREETLTSDVVKAIREIKMDKDFWNVQWQGVSVSIRPFLCSALSFAHMDELLSLFCTYIAESSETFYDDLMSMKRSDYYGLFTEDENNWFKSILCQLDSQIPCVARYFLGRSDIANQRVRKLMFILLTELVFYCSDSPYIRFKDKDVCNTEAFSYFLSIYWVLQKSKKLQVLLSKEIKMIDFQSTLLSLCPEESIHYKCFVGEISTGELLDKYKYIAPINTGVVLKELYNLVSFSLDRGHTDEDNYLLAELYESYTRFIGFDNFVRTMACGYITMGYYNRSKTRLSDLLTKQEDLESRNLVLDKENRQLKSAFRLLTKEKAHLESDYEKLQRKRDNFKLHDDKVKELNKIIAGLKDKVSDLEVKLDLRNSEILQQKKVIRSKIKELKSLNARLNEVADDNSDSIEESTEITSISIEEMASQLVGKKIGVFGGFDAGNLTDKFKAYNLDIKHFINEEQFIVGALDCAVVLTGNIQHKTVKRLKSQYNGNYVYLTGTSIELMIQEVYNTLIGGNCIGECN